MKIIVADPAAAAQWHRRPPGSKGPCLICAAPASSYGAEHRLVQYGPGQKPAWQRRKRSAEGWVLSNPIAEVPPAVRDKIMTLTRRLADGLTMTAAAGEMGFVREEVRYLRRRYPGFFAACLNQFQQEAAAAVARAPVPVLVVPEDPIAPAYEGLRLAKFAAEYCRRGVGYSRLYQAIILRVVRHLSTHLRRPTVIEDLTGPTLCKFLNWALERWPPRTVKGYRVTLLTLAKSAWEADLLPSPPRGVGKIKVMQAVPKAWNLEEVQRLIAQAATLPGSVGKLPAADWWVSLLLTIYWTAARIGSMLVATPGDYHPGRGIWIRNVKSRKMEWHDLPASCCERIDAILGEREFLWAWPAASRPFRQFRQIVEAAGITAAKGHGSLFHRLRRTSISYCDRADPRLAQQQAGHESYEVTRKHYIDPTISGPKLSAVGVLPDPLAVRALPQPAAFTAAE